MDGENTADLVGRLKISRPSVNNRIHRIEDLCGASTTIEAITVILIGKKSIEEAIDCFMKKHRGKDEANRRLLRGV